MKKKIFLFFLVAAVGIAFMTVAPLPSQAAPIKLTYSCFFPPKHIQSKLAESWCREVEKRTNGRVKVEYYPAGTLTKAKQCYDGVVTGLSDIGFSVLAYTRGRFPVLAAIDLPMGYTSGMAATQVVMDFYKEFNPKEVQDTKVMYLHSHGPGLVHTKDKPVKKLEDMKGLKLRGHGTSALVQKALGATPVAKPMPECYQMIQKGVVEGASYPFEANKGWRLGEVTNFATAAFSAAYTTTFFVAMNKDKWNSLPKDIQKIIDAVNEEWVIKHGEEWDKSDLKGIQFFLSKGGTIIGLDAKEAARWKKAVAPVAEKYVADMKKKGFKDAQKYVDYVRASVDKYSK
ncbi:MAG: TRAP transporter substrate-binding protein [Desulfobacterales bacterium]|nr:TRAP transporter substrate-binding protein [Desulfobacterales bacterium]